MGDQMEFLAPGFGLAIADIWGVNQWMDDLSLPPPFK